MSRIPIGATLVFLAASSLTGWAQTAPAQPKNKQQAKAAKQKWAGQKLTPTQQLEQLLQMAPEEREQYLSQLSPKQREQMETRIANLEKLPPEQREKRLKRLEVMGGLTAARKEAVRQEIVNVRAMTFVRRRAYLHSKEFEQNYSPAEQDLIRETFPGAAK